jgi:hypothetical protein
MLIGEAMMNDYTRQPHHLLALSSLTLAAGLIMLVVGIALAYLFDLRLNIAELIGAHALTILGPTAIKIGYVMRLVATHQPSVSEATELAHVAC